MNRKARAGIRSRRELVTAAVHIRRDQHELLRAHPDLVKNFSAFVRERFDALMGGEPHAVSPFVHTKQPPTVRSIYVFADQLRWTALKRINRSLFIQHELDALINDHRKPKEGERNGDGG